MQIIECLILSISPEVAHDIGTKVLCWFLLLLSIVLLFFFIKRQVDHDCRENKSSDFDEDEIMSYDGRSILLCVGIIVLMLIELFP